MGGRNHRIRKPRGPIANRTRFERWQKTWPALAERWGPRLPRERPWPEHDQPFPEERQARLLLPTRCQWRCEAGSSDLRAGATVMIIRVRRGIRPSRTRWKPRPEIRRHPWFAAHMSPARILSCFLCPLQGRLEEQTG